MQISSGKGPDECELAVSLFLKSYQIWVYGSLFSRKAQFLK